MQDSIKRLLNDPRVIKAKGQFGEIVDRSLDQHLRIAVTGLSKSGKTVFITSLINQLLHSNQPGLLPLFTPAREGRILGVKRTLHPHLTRSAFPYQDALAALNKTPSTWPSSTRGLSEQRLIMRYESKHWMRKTLQNDCTLTLDIIDYPGEWLLDLPLINMDFQDWCKQCAELYWQIPRRNIFQPWLQAISELDLTAPANFDTLNKLSALYTECLHNAKKPEYNLSIIQPGRFVLPGELAGAPVLAFFPLVHTNLDDIDVDPLGNSYYAELVRRFDYYKEHVVKAFYREHFSSFDRQIVLVDCLSALNQGYYCLYDMQQAMNSILESFNYGQTGFLTRLFKPKIDYVLFAATKADHATRSERKNMSELLAHMLQVARNHIQFEGVTTDHTYMASIRVTEDTEAVVNGEKIECIRGDHKGQKAALFPGQVPTSLPSVKSLPENTFNFIGFDPTPMHDSRYHALSHIKMDQVLERLLTDKLE